MEIKGNTIYLTGRVTYIDTKHYGNSSVTRILISKKVSDNEYDSFGINFFKDKSDKISQQIVKGDYIAIEGYLRESKYTKDGVEHKRLTINGNDYVKVKYDEKEKKYVEDKNVLPTIDDAFPQEDKTPWD